MDEWALLDEVDILPKLPKDFFELLESKKWTDRRDALQGLIDELTKSPKLDPKANYGELTTTLRNVLAKDANINVSALAAKAITGIADGLRTKFAPFASMFIPVVLERFKEKKPVLKDPLVECIDAIAKTVNLEAVSEEAVEGMDKPNPNVKLQSANFVFRALKEYSPANGPKKFIKAIVPLLVKFLTDPDAEVRESACVALGGVMRLTGEKVMGTFLGQLQEDKIKMKKIMDGRDQAVKDVAEVEAKRLQAAPGVAGTSTVNGVVDATEPVVQPGAPAAVEVDVWDMLEPVDVLAKLSPAFMEGVESKKWQERRDALQLLQTLCSDNPRLCPKASYGEHVAILKKILEKDANINVCALAARCFTAFATGLRKKFAPYASLVAPVMFEKFKEKRPILRDPLNECIDAVVASTTLEAMGEDVQAALEKANPNIKIQTNLFLYRVFMKFNAQTMPKKLLKTLVPIIIKHTGDSDPEVRDASYSALGAAMKAVGEKPCMVLLADIAEDKTKMAKIRDFRDKAAKEAGSDVVSAMVQSIHKSDQEGVKPAEQNNEAKNEGPLKPPASSLGSKAAGKNSKTKLQETEDRSEEKSSPPNKEVTSAMAFDEPAKDKESALVTNREKVTRLKDEKNFRVLKWSFDQPTGEHMEQLHTQFESVAVPTLCSMLFSKDFKQHLKALDILDALVLEDSDAIAANSDLILKWISLRFFETNQQVLLRALDLASKVLTVIQTEKEQFSEAELTSFLPYLITKLGEAKDSIRGPVRKIVLLLTEIASPPKVFPYIVDGLKIKNSRLRAECLQILLMILDANGLNGTSTPGPSLKAIAACISDRDSNVRNAALNAIVSAYREAGDVVFQLVGKMNDKDQAMLEERIKRSGAVPKTRGLPANAPAANGRKSRPSIGVAVKGGKNNPRKRSTSRPRSRASSQDYNPSEEESSGERSPAEENEGNRTFIADPSSRGDATRPRFSLNMRALGIDKDAPENLQPEDDDEVTLLLNPLDDPARRRTQNGPPPRRTESIGSITSLDSHAGGDIDKTIHGIASITPSTALKSLSQLQYLFQEPMLFRFLVERMDSLVQAIVTQTSLIRSRHLNDFSILQDVNELVRAISNFLCSLVREHTQCMQLSTDNLKMLIQEFLYLLKDERLKRLKGVSEIFRSLNYLTIRVCDNAEPTNFYLALISMLGSALRDPQNETVVLISKCIIKQTDQFIRPNFISETPMDLDAVVFATNEFMTEFCSKAEETSVVKEARQCVELAMQRLCLSTKGSILNHTSRISDPEKSEVVIYLRRCVHSFTKNKKWDTVLCSPAKDGLPGQVVGAGGDCVREVISAVVREPCGPFGKEFKELSSSAKTLPNIEKKLDEALKENIQHGEFIRYNLKRAVDADREGPEVLSETKKAIDSIRSVESTLKAFFETGVWSDVTNGRPIQPAGAPSGNANVSRIGQPMNAVSGNDFAEEDSELNASRSTSDSPHKQTLTASDVEPLRQLLNRRRRVRE